jgi:hypothetical protein
MRAALKRALGIALGSLLLPSPVLSANGDEPPIGVYLWFPDPAGPASDADCEALAARLNPSVKQAQDWLSGIAGDFDPETGPYYLVVSKHRMEPTFSGEGDYDTGTVAFGQTFSNLTPFTLVPDDYPHVTITGSILASASSLIVTVTLKDVPQEEGARDRVVRYCRFADGEVT